MNWIGARRSGALGWLALVLAVPGAVGAQGSAFDELDRIRSAYRELGAYSDRGEIHRVVRGRGGGEVRESISFELFRDGAGGFRFRLSPPAGSDQVLWTTGKAAYRFDGDLGQYREVASAAAELARLLGEGGQDALIVPALLLGIPQALPEPDGAALDDGRFDGRPARILTLSSLGGTLETELTADAETALLRRVRVVLHRPLPGASDASSAGGARLEIEVLHHPEPGVPPRAHNWLDPPEGARQVAQWQRPPPYRGSKASKEASPATTPSGDPVPGNVGPRSMVPSNMGPDNTVPGDTIPGNTVFGDTVQVALVTYAVRVLKPDGSPVRDLGLENFRVRLGRKDLHLRAVDWVEAGSSPVADLPPEVLAETGITLPPPGKLLVLFVQAGLQGGRMQGHMKQMFHVRTLLDFLNRDDRVAVVSFDSHLKLRLDFSRDHDRVMEVLAEAYRFGKKVPRLPVGRYPSLARSFDYEKALKAASPERALELTANALAPLLGEKDLVFVGWGVGHYDGGGIRYGKDYDRALAALAQANASVSVLDISQADFHTLELGLQQVAKDTGGSYERTFRRERIATARLARTLEGHYLLTFEHPDPDKPIRRSRLIVRLRDARGEVIVGQPSR